MTDMCKAESSQKAISKPSWLIPRRLAAKPELLIKGAARGGAEGAQAPPLAIRILMFIS